MREVPWDVIISVAATTATALIYRGLQREASVVAGAKQLLNEKDVLTAEPGVFAVVQGLARAHHDNELLSCGTAGDIKAILHEQVLQRHYAKWSELWKEWIRYSQVLTTNFRSIPFQVCSLVDDKTVLAHVPPPSSTPADLDLDTVNVSFAPSSDKSFAQGIVEVFQSERQLGLETIDKALTPNGHITVLGEVALGEKGLVQLIRPTKRLPYIISRRTYADIVASRVFSATVSKYVMYGCLGGLCVVLGRRLWKWYQKWQVTQKRGGGTPLFWNAAIFSCATRVVRPAKRALFAEPPYCAGYGHICRAQIDAH
ncbi:hypothetical protein SeLEV6574_g05405 [Synchytrium endobioticum]|uniref:RING-type E3 ubiquitin transferase n=1 Tax=Synchytrium endobioticum TaxID=286115 RepID=A0A507CUT3_9FUNG|nr:hypothetical protein SeLEV6574_g05405 [Synchytrium endobioticum]